MGAGCAPARAAAAGPRHAARTRTRELPPMAPAGKTSSKPAPKRRSRPCSVLRQRAGGGGAEAAGGQVGAQNGTTVGRPALAPTPDAEAIRRSWSGPAPSSPPAAPTCARGRRLPRGQTAGTGRAQEVSVEWAARRRTASGRLTTLSASGTSPQAGTRTPAARQPTHPPARRRSAAAPWRRPAPAPPVVLPRLLLPCSPLASPCASAGAAGAPVPR